MKIRGVLASAAVAGALATSVLAAAPAQAVIVNQCAGTRIATFQPKNEMGEGVGRVELWYSSADNGTNCVMTYDLLGGAHQMVAELRVKDGRTERDSGTYQYYAGGAALKNTNGKCVQAYGFISTGMYRLNKYSVTSQWGWCR